MKLGIDIGTSYSSVALLADDKIDMVKLSTGTCAFGDSYSMPTAVYMDNSGMLVGQAAFNKRILDPSRFRSEFKRDFGTTTPYLLGGEEYLPEQIYTELFLHIKKQSIQQAGEEIEVVYVTHPANYGNNKKLLLEKAAHNAGLLQLAFVDEPTAAAIGYAQKNKISDGDILLVYDLGGGTFDVALIKKTDRGYMHLTEPLGISQCGGVDFDRAIFDDILKKLKESERFDIDRLVCEKRFVASLLELCIQIKHQLSQAEVHTQPIAVGFDYFDYSITRKEFEQLIQPIVTRTCDKLKDVIYNAGLTAGDIDKVLMVGGSSRIPLVRDMVGKTLGTNISYDSDPELTICQGAVGTAFIQKSQEEQKRKAEEEQRRLALEEQARAQAIQRQLEEEQRRIKEEQLRLDAMKRQHEEELIKIKERSKVSSNAKTEVAQKTGISFRMKGFRDFIKDNKPFILKGYKIVISIDDEYEVEIPPNPTKFVELESGEHQIFVYGLAGLMKKCKTLQTIHLKENEKCEIEIKIPNFAWEKFKLYCNNKKIN